MVVRLPILDETSRRFVLVLLPALGEVVLVVVVVFRVFDAAGFIVAGS